MTGVMFFYGLTLSPAGSVPLGWSQEEKTMSKSISLIQKVHDAPPLSVSKEQTLSMAQGLMTEHKIRHLPVMSGGQWVGMINGLLTLRGASDKVRTEPMPKFRVLGVVAIAIGSVITLAPMIATNGLVDANYKAELKKPYTAPAPGIVFSMSLIVSGFHLYLRGRGTGF
ncbi:MAG: hypothetical protein EBX52_12990 [Proteobacteria bacterium]|nr:hypothetical protein [Pseudomonadota bacterium]